MAVVQNGIKLLLIYSTVCQLGYVLLGVSLGTSLGVAGGLMHFVNHMLLKDTLFLVAGAVMVASHATMLDELGGLGRRMPITFGIFLFSGLSLAGMPPFNGFSSKWMIFMAAFQSGHWLLGAAAMIGSLFTLAAVMKFAHAAFMGTPTPKALAAKEAPLAMLIPMGALGGGSVVVGFFPGLLLAPIAAIQANSALQPIAATLTGPLPGLEGWSPLLLIAACADPRRVTRALAAARTPGRHRAHSRPSVRRRPISRREAIRAGTVKLYERPTPSSAALCSRPKRAAEDEKA